MLSLLAFPILTELFGTKKQTLQLQVLLPTGDLSYQIGIAFLMLAGTLFIRNTKLQRVIISSMLATIFLMQIPPIFSWWTFNGSVLTENAEPAVEFKANWGYSIPHIILLLVALLSLYLLNRGRPKREDTS